MSPRRDARDERSNAHSECVRLEVHGVVVWISHESLCTECARGPSSFDCITQLLDAALQQLLMQQCEQKFAIKLF